MYCIKSSQEKIEQVEYDMKRVKAVRLGDDWAQREEEYMRINMQVKKLEDSERLLIAEKEELEKLLKKSEGKSMEFLFEKTQWEAKFIRMENRIKELETMLNAQAEQDKKNTVVIGRSGAASGTSSSSGAGMNNGSRSDGAAAGTASTRREKNLEAVVEGLEQVINKLKKDNHRQIQELERHHRESRKQGAMHAEIERLRQELSAKSNANTDDAVSFADKIKHLHDTIEACNARNAETEEKVERLLAEREKREKTITELNALREEDREALDVAQELMQDVTQTEERYRAIVSDNKKMQTKLSKFESPAFRERLETLEIFWSSGKPLMGEATGILAELKKKYPSLTIPERLMESLNDLLVAAA
eukprot:g11191.t1